MGDVIEILTTATNTVEVEAQGPQGAPGQGVPTGGSALQILRKASGADYDTEWAAAGAGSGSVTSVALASADLTISGSPITTSGTITANFSAATTASLALADSAVQPGDLATVATSGSYADLANIPSTFTPASHTHATAVADPAGSDGFLSSADKQKLDGIATSANNYTHPNHTGDVTSSGDGATTIANSAVTYAKIQNVTATDKLLGRSTAGAGVVEEIACTSAGRALIDDADASEQRTTLGLGSAATSNVGDFAAASHTHPLTDITDATVASTGLLTGGVLSTGAGATEYSITDGTGVIATAAGAVTSVSWTGKTNITPTNLASALLTWVSIDNAGNVVERTTPISASQARSEISLGVVVHTDLATVQAVNNEQVISYQTGNTVHDLADAIGFVNINGNVFTANGANLSLNKSAGVMFKLGGNYDQDTTNPHNRTIAANTLAQFQYRYSDGTSGPLTDTLIDPDNLDDGAGGLTAVTNNRWSVQRIYIFLSGNIKIQRGVADFPTKAAAIEGIASEAYVTEPSIAANGLLRGWLVVKKGATDLSDDSVAQFISAPKFGEGSTGGASTPPGDSSAILLPALKASAGTINVGEVVRSTGYSGGQILVELADANAAGGMPAMGVARSSFNEASAGTVIFSGVLEGLDTSSFAVNDSLYVSSTAGVLTNTRPTGAATGVQAIARVLSQDASNGVIQVIGAGRTNDLPNLTADTLWYGNGSAVPTETSITSAGRALIDDADATAQRTTLGLGNSSTLDTGTGAGTVATGDHTHTQLHDRSHAITSTSDHTAGNHKVFYSDGSGNVTELALGASGEVLTSNGAAAAPTWETPSGGGSSIMQSIAVGFVLN